MAGVLLITGGSRSIGAAMARLAAAEGYAVAINYRKRADAAEAVVAEIAAAGGSAAAFQGDVTWLLSDAASFISGTCLDASGGGFIVDHR